MSQEKRIRRGHKGVVSQSLDSSFSPLGKKVRDEILQS